MIDEQTARSRALAFYEIDEDPETRAELKALLEDKSAASSAELIDRFNDILRFGTAGIRGAMGAGTARMNRVVVQRATWGFGKHVLNTLGERSKTQGIVVCFDGRKNSRQFADDTCAVLNALGIKTHLADYCMPTPVCAYAVTHLKAAGGVMVTASHNPPADNGYKVYWNNGAQIIPPHDKEIASLINEAPQKIEMLSPYQAAASGYLVELPNKVVEKYHQDVRKRAHHDDVFKDKEAALKIVYTAMHGVGHRDVREGLRNAGFHQVISVPSQADPDHTFRTVAFPNPEEEGALDLALALAEKHQAHLVVANDPDADRISVSLPARDGKGYVSLSGNDVGALLGADAIDHQDTGGKKKLVITTLVSSTMLSRIARDKDAEFRETLTGFKWIANTAIDVEKSGVTNAAGKKEDVQFVFGFEEALGVSVSNLVRDKDGVSGAVRIAELCAHLKVQGKTLHDKLDELAVEHGLSVGENWSVKCAGAKGLQQIADWMTSFREHPPTSLNESKVDRVVDLMKENEKGFPPSNVVIIYAEDGTRLIVRPSGTEPKIKFYIDVVDESVKSVSDVESARSVLSEKCKKMRAEIEERLNT